MRVFSFSLPAIILDRTVQFCLEMDSLSLILLPLHAVKKWFFNGFDKAVANVPAFFVTPVSATLTERLLCHLEKFALVSLGRTSNSTTMCLKGRRNDFFSLLTLFYSGKTQRAFKSQASTQWKENGHSESLFCNCLVFLLWYCIASKFKCYLGDLAKHLPQLFTHSEELFLSPSASTAKTCCFKKM